jgi:voltage-gated potassium channel
MRRSFLELTLFIAAWMLLAPLLRDRWLTQLALQAFLLNAVLVTLSANPEWRNLRRAVIALWVVALAGSLNEIIVVPTRVEHLARSAQIVSMLPLLALLCIGILRYVFRRRELTLDGIFATIAVYLLVGLLFALLYLLLLEWNPASFNLPAEKLAQGPALVQSAMIYYSMITLATVGYGDILPLTDTARTLAVLEATVGQFYVAVIVAVFVGMYSSQRRP